MDLILLVTAFSGLVIVLLFYFVFKYQKTKSGTSTLEAENVDVQQRAAPRRAIGTRNRMRGGVAAPSRSNAVNDNNQQAVEEDDDKPGLDINDPKIGAKKRAKLEAKAEKKSQREAELKMREQRKKQQEKDESERKLQDEKAKLEEEKLEEEKRRLEEEKQRKEEEEYQKMKEAFTIEEDGFDEGDESEQENLLQNFVNHIKETKVVMLEDIAAKFNLKIQTVISRIEDLLASGVLTGVIDDRGKFIYITVEELEAVAEFVKKRGRVTIQELVENSNNLITLC